MNVLDRIVNFHINSHKPTMPVGFNEHGTTSAQVNPSGSQRPVAAISWKRHDGAGEDGFTFDLNDVSPVSLPASYYEGEILEKVKFPPSGSIGSINLNQTMQSGDLCNACFVVKTYRASTKYLQPIVLPPGRTDNPLKSPWSGTLPDPDGMSERIFAAGYKSGTDAEVKEAGKPQWVVLSEKQPSGSARRSLSGK